MKTSLLSLLTGTFLFGISACTKNGSDSNTGGTNPPPTPGQSTVLAAVYVVDTTLVAAHDTVERYNITFDGLNRISVITELDTKPNGDSDYYSIQALTYNGSDTNATRRTEYERTFSGGVATITRDTSYYAFTNGKCVYDSTSNPNWYYMDQFAYVTNAVLRTGRALLSGVKSTHQSTIYQTFVNGDLTYQIDTLVSHDVTVVNPAFFSYQRREVSTSYLTNPNPFYQLAKNFFRPYYDDDLAFQVGEHLNVLLHNSTKRYLSGVVLQELLLTI